MKYFNNYFFVYVYFAFCNLSNPMMIRLSFINIEELELLEDILP
jgi:hypothetical protein